MYAHLFIHATGDKLCIIRHPPLPGSVRGATVMGQGPGWQHNAVTSLVPTVFLAVPV